jgi:hypothetical protein
MNETIHCARDAFGHPFAVGAAALGCTILQLLAIIFHVARGEWAVTPLHFILLALCLFVLWGRFGQAPIRPRQR